VLRRLGWPRSRGRVERRILDQDRLLEALQSLARIEAELVAQRRARFLHHDERVRLATGPVQGEHQQLAQPLAQRVLADQHLQLGDRLAVSTDRKVGLQTMLERHKAQRFQPADLVLRERLVAEVRQRRTAPQRERAAQHLARLSRGPSGKQLPALVQQPLKPLQIERAVLDPHQVAARSRLDHPITQRLPQVRHVHLQPLNRSRGRLLIPQRINEPLRRHRLARVQQQDRKQRALLRRPQLELGPVLPDRQRTENPELHPSNVTPATNKLQAPPCQASRIVAIGPTKTWQWCGSLTPRARFLTRQQKRLTSVRAPAATMLPWLDRRRGDNDGVYDHESIVVASDGTTNLDGTLNWDLVDAHTNNRYHAYWTLAQYNASWATTHIVVVHIPDTTN
jgi:hypothetical protein